MVNIGSGICVNTIFFCKIPTSSDNRSPITGNCNLLRQEIFFDTNMKYPGCIPNSFTVFITLLIFLHILTVFFTISSSIIQHVDTAATLFFF